MKTIKQTLLTLVATFAAGLATAQTVNVTDATVGWDFNQGTESPTAATVSADNAVSSTSYTLGSKLKINGTQAAGGETLTKLNPTEKIGGTADEACCITFSLKPKKGVSFTAKSLSFNAAKFGTSGGTLDIYAVSGEQKVALSTGYNPVRNNTGCSSESLDMTALGTVSDKVDIVFYVYNLAQTKQLGMNKIVVTGDFAGTAEEVASYTFSVTSAMPEAGTVSYTPSGTTFDDGTQIKVSTTENFGYHFQGWQDADGNTVSTDNPYTFELKANTVLTATYTKNNVYPINLTLEGGANANLVQFAPEGNVVDGKHYYEEGTEVKLTALNNRIITFTNWEDNTTAAERELKMDGEKNLTATFSAADFIVGWDLYNDEPKSERAADYKAESDNAGLLSLRNAAGNTTSWLSRGSSNGQENGKYAARIWKNLTDEYYFEISFSAKEYSNLVLSAAVGDDYNTYSINNAQWSIDGENYTTFGTFNPPSRGWDSQEFALPADVNGQERVYIRFMPDRTSPLIGVSSDYDGTSVAEIFVLADRDASSDTTPPVLVSTLPADGSTGASASGSIILTFDEKVRLAEGDATLDGETLSPILSGKSVVYQYSGLKYATSYTFTLPAGAITDRNGNAFAGTSFSFTTMERTQPEARLYDAIVAQDNSGDYTTVQAAIDAAPTDRVKPWLIFVKNGQYKEHIDIPATKPYLHIIGQDRDKTVILDDKLCGGDNALHVSVGATVVVNANDCFFENITLENSYGHEKQTGPQALALNTTADRTIFNNVAMLSYQDTWITPSKSNYRAFVYRSLIEGAVDFIYNSGNIYLEGDTLLINRKSGGYIVAPSHGKDVEWGYVFNHCVITAEGVPSETSIWLGRPWHNFPKTVFLNTRTEVTIPATGWYETMGGLPAIWADWNTTDGDGNLLDLSQRRDTYYYTDSSTGEKVYGKAKNHLTDEEAAQYTVKNVLSGSDNWQPELKTEACAAPAPQAEAGVLSWEAVPYAICYVVTSGDDVIAITTDTQVMMAAGKQAADYTVQAVNEFGGLSEKGTGSTSTAIDNAAAAQTFTPQAIYTADGRQTASLVPGLNIIKGTDQNGRTVIRKVMR